MSNSGEQHGGASTGDKKKSSKGTRSCGRMASTKSRSSLVRMAGGGSNCRLISKYLSSLKRWQSKKPQAAEAEDRGPRALVCCLKKNVAALVEYQKATIRCPVAGVPTFEPCYILSQMMCKLNELDCYLQKGGGTSDPCDCCPRIKRHEQLLCLVRGMKVALCKEIKSGNWQPRCPNSKMEYIVHSLTCLELELCKLLRYLREDCRKRHSGGRQSFADTVLKRDSFTKSRENLRSNNKFTVGFDNCRDREPTRKSSSKNIIGIFKKKSLASLASCKKKSKSLLSCCASVVSGGKKPPSDVPCKPNYEITGLKLKYSKSRVIDRSGGSDESESSECDGDDRVVKKRVGNGLAETSCHTHPDGSMSYKLRYRCDDSEPPSCDDEYAPSDDGDPESQRIKCVEAKVKDMSKSWFESARILCEALRENHANIARHENSDEDAC